MTQANELDFELLSAQFTFLGDYFSLINPISGDNNIIYFANLILVIADIILLQSIQKEADELVQLGNNLTVLGDILIASQDS
mgnify:CR=1 FL=1